MKAKIIQDLLDKSQKNLNESMSQYISNPKRDFIRNRKLPFEKVISSVLGMKGRSLNNELLYQSGCAMETPTPRLLSSNEVRLITKHLNLCFTILPRWR